MNHTYHYFAERADGTRVTTIDGIARLSHPIASMEMYEKLKSMISKDQDLADDGDLIIRSLSYLGLDPPT